MRIDNLNGNSLWLDAVNLEMTHMKTYSVFEDLGKGIPIPEGYKNIHVHLIFDVKHDGRHCG